MIQRIQNTKANTNFGSITLKYPRAQLGTMDGYRTVLVPNGINMKLYGHKPDSYLGAVDLTKQDKAGFLRRDLPADAVVIGDTDIIAGRKSKNPNPSYHEYETISLIAKTKEIEQRLLKAFQRVFGEDSAEFVDDFSPSNVCKTGKALPECKGQGSAIIDDSK